MTFSFAAIVLGIVASQLQSAPGAGLPGYWAIPIALFVPWLKRWRWLALGLAAFLWGDWAASTWSGGRLPIEVAGQDLRAVGVVRGFPAELSGRTRFTFAIERIEGVAFSGHARLNWYSESPVALEPGERRMLTVRLRPPRGLRNPAGFDYQRWLYVHDVRAVGYVRGEFGDVTPASDLAARVDRLRYALAGRIGRALDGAPTAGLVKALAVGDRSGIDGRQWDILRRTGTAHLIAISGLHVGLAATWAHLLVGFTWRRSSRLVLWWPAPRAAALAAVLAAAAYTVLAGASVPTQRALLMVMVFAAAPLLGRHWLSRDALLGAAALVALAHPGSVLGAGYWMSFTAVAVIVWVAGTWRGGAERSHLAARFLALARLQLGIGVGLVPVTALVFDALPLIGPLVNLIAIPFTGLLVVPAILLACIATAFASGAGEWLFGVAGEMVALAWPCLERAAAVPTWSAPGARPAWTVVGAAVGVVVLLAPRGVPYRLVGLLWMLPLLLVQPSRPDWGEVRATVLDVGHGLAVVVETASHVLIYDTGSGGERSFDAGHSVVVPFLAARGHRNIDRIVVSHADRDHSGGLAAILSAYEVARLIGAPSDASLDAQPCRRGDWWSWDGVRFEVLHPRIDDRFDRNDRSCVIGVRAASGSILLTGDIESRAERLLVEREGGRLRADVLIAPHHGSATSSTEAFLRSVSPAFVLVSAPFGGRRALPATVVLERYRRLGLSAFSTGDCGALTIARAAGASLALVRSERGANARFWAGTPNPRAVGSSLPCPGLRQVSR